mmetsp:Transcript_32708/g.113219  ORF Transcript_32708/g.113219 Transcript_32708/m.113219 type:complete len:206 (+) Transcript_32708:836-1453(+)
MTMAASSARLEVDSSSAVRSRPTRNSRSETFASASGSRKRCRSIKSCSLNLSSPRRLACAAGFASPRLGEAACACSAARMATTSSRSRARSEWRWLFTASPAPVSTMARSPTSWPSESRSRFRPWRSSTMVMLPSPWPPCDASKNRIRPSTSRFRRVMSTRHRRISARPRSRTAAAARSRRTRRNACSSSTWEISPSPLPNSTSM